MNLNLTLFGQAITFAIFVGFTMRYVWPPLMKALLARKDNIADGLAAAERGRHELELAQKNSVEQIREAKTQATEIIDKANIRGSQLIEEAKVQALEEGKRLNELAREEINLAIANAKKELRQQVAGIAIASAEKILGQNIDSAANNVLVDELINEI